ncbi:unnamed protein product [Rangifer tarandus platyrhynchus]|uniref:Uncharacterized protein n=1 Tax=Rangifer tarandus platyrhynchus TaxID=3082113 RepID=A0AC59Z840_RANTA
MPFVLDLAGAGPPKGFRHSCGYSGDLPSQVIKQLLLVPGPSRKHGASAGPPRPPFRGRGPVYARAHRAEPRGREIGFERREMRLQILSTGKHSRRLSSTRVLAPKAGRREGIAPSKMLGQARSSLTSSPHHRTSGLYQQ